MPLVIVVWGLVSIVLGGRYGYLNKRYVEEYWSRKGLPGNPLDMAALVAGDVRILEVTCEMWQASLTAQSDPELEALRLRMMRALYVCIGWAVGYPVCVGLWSLL
jgi:hypothetical protein